MGGPSNVQLSFSRHGSYGWIQTTDALWHVSSYAPEGGSWDLADVRVYSEVNEERLRAAERQSRRQAPEDWCLADAVSERMPPSPAPPSCSVESIAASPCRAAKLMGRRPALDVAPASAPLRSHHIANWRW